jgi:hypothetical protein
MKELIKVAAFSMLVLALSPLLGFWIVALVGAGLVLLPVGAVISTIFPNARKWVEGSLLHVRAPLSAA